MFLIVIIKAKSGYVKQARVWIISFAYDCDFKFIYLALAGGIK